MPTYTVDRRSAQSGSVDVVVTAANAQEALEKSQLRRPGMRRAAAPPGCLLLVAPHTTIWVRPKTDQEENAMTKKKTTKKTAAQKKAAPKTTKKVAAKPEKVAAKPKAERKAPNPEGHSAAVAESWKDKDVAARRKERSAVTVDGELYGSVAKAFTAIGVPLSRVVKFRLKLKASGKEVLEHDGKSYKFAIAA